MADSAGIRKLVQEYHPDVIVNATAYTAVDKAESERELAAAVNGAGPGVLAEAARKLDAVLIHYSTDYVFDGAKGSPYLETDLPHPVNVYGQSKLEGEQAIQSASGNFLIFRTAWVYSLRRESFVTKVLGWARKNETLRVVDDQVSNPTWARMLAEITAQILARGAGYLRERTGLFHLAGGGHASRYAWTQEILRLDPARQEQKVKQILPAKSSDFPTAAQRPLFSALECRRFEQTFDLALPAWQAALELALAG
jgi:dTDP-4-dehydrorhamnose reductase